MRTYPLGEITVFLMDLLAIGALASTGELRAETFALVGIFFALSRFRLFALGEKTLAGFLALCILGTLASRHLYAIPLIIAVARTVPVLHASLWFADKSRESGRRARFGRIAVGFVELNVTAVLTSEFYLAILIFLFALLASVAIASGFLERALREHEGKTGTTEPAHIPRSFFSHILGVSSLVLFTSFLIFPTLPRIRTGAGLGSGQRTVGYTEQVNLSSSGALLGSGGGSSALLLYYPEGVASSGQSKNSLLASELFLGLIRGRTLSDFDGITWRAAEHDFRLKSARRPGLSSPRTADSQAAPRFDRGSRVELEAIRQPLNSATLPVPYGTSRVLLRNGDSYSSPIQLGSGEWLDPTRTDHAVSYRLVINHDASLAFGSGPDDSPRDTHLKVPGAVNTKRIQDLARRLFPGDLGTPEKISHLQRFFLQEGFRASTDGIDEDSDENIGDDEIERAARNHPALERYHPIEKFLFITKKGHCELFSGAAAVLLRMAGVPTRLVAGFRVSRGSMEGMLNVRTGDGHAWLEYWIPERGWKALDLTPRIMVAPSFVEFVRTLYETASALWYRQMSGYESSSAFGQLKSYFTDKTGGSQRYYAKAQRSLEGWMSERKGLLLWLGLYLLALSACAFLIIRTWFPWILSIRWKVNQGPGWIKRERIHMEQFLARKLYNRWMLHPAEGLDFKRAAGDLRALYGEAAMACFFKWERTYLSARFGKISLYPREARSQLHACYREFRELLKFKSDDLKKIEDGS